MYGWIMFTLRLAGFLGLLGTILTLDGQLQWFAWNDYGKAKLSAQLKWRHRPPLILAVNRHSLANVEGIPRGPGRTSPMHNGLA
jgi:hypothetical protein